jgi:Flp pilus assembly protein CpaB
MQNLLSTRMGTIFVGTAAAVIAAVILLIYTSQYRDSVKKQQAPVAVLVANELIAKGTSGDLVGSNQMYSITKIPADRVKDGAITDPHTLTGLIANKDIFPGEQLRASEFDNVSSTDLTSKITATQRAISVPLDGAHGLIGYIQSGDHVDVLAGFQVIGADGKTHPVLKTIMQDILVLNAPSTSSKGGLGGSSGQASNVVMRMTDTQAADMAFSSDNGKIWILLRPPTGAVASKPSLVTLETLLFGVPAIAVNNALRRAAVNGGN